MTAFAPTIIGTLTILVVIGIAVTLESAYPTTRRVAKTVVVNTVYAVFIAIWTRVLQPIAEVESEFLHRHLAISPIPLPKNGWPILFSATILMLAADLIFYWVHRAQHRYRFLWAMHSFHHSDDDLNVTTAYRHYWLEKPLFLL